MYSYLFSWGSFFDTYSFGSIAGLLTFMVALVFLSLVVRWRGLLADAVSWTTTLVALQRSWASGLVRVLSMVRTQLQLQSLRYARYVSALNRRYGASACSWRNSRAIGCYTMHAHA